MIAKVIAHGATREEARTRLVRALRETVVLGPTTNRHFLIRLLEHPEFAAGKATTAFLGKHEFPAPAIERRALAARGRPAVAAVGLTLSRDAARLAQLQSRADAHPARRRRQRTPAACRRRRTASTSTCRSTSTATTSSSTSTRSPCASPTRPTPRPPRRRPAATASCARRWTAASSPSRSRPATASRKGQTLIVLEAMKIQHQLKAALDAKVESVAVKEGQQVANRAILVHDGGRCRCTLKSVSHSYGTVEALAGIELDIADGETDRADRPVGLRQVDPARHRRRPARTHAPAGSHCPDRRQPTRSTPSPTSSRISPCCPGAALPTMSAWRSSIVRSAPPSAASASPRRSP